PGMKGSKAILLNRYMQFIRPGKYQIKCKFDPEISDELLNDTVREEIRDTIYVNVYEDQEQLNKIIAAIERDIREGDLEAQLRGMVVLSELRVVQAVSMLAHGLSSNNDALVEIAIAGLGNLGNQAAVEMLQDFIASATSLSLQQKARQALQKI